ncbi:MAG TPA: OB-fold nucleic acid binding domain-containing protein [Methanothrix sp.]|nr:hypothetical protein [Methanothrix sp.]HOV82936.1 OB-fold nucleic acid binding domain-containing protein [Methanothrix sp.]HPC90487.1 OB-fold nucleic acid binding domain-containing protein [Methanothrix sp.]HQE88246.1 OB-fold nucleic acid binding domain-containing protein [Methanothrix sp.]HQI68255.1 OB-fold nucleic acid binding domain-containing protein [Methanothrix sp.]
MRLQKEEMVVFVLLLMALGSLSVAFWAFSPDVGGAAPGSSASSSSPFSALGVSTATSSSARNGGQSLSVQGRITELKMTQSGGHLLIELDSTSLPVFVPARSGAEELAGRLGKGDLIAVKGIVREYQGREEIEVSRSTDVVNLR